MHASDSLARARSVLEDLERFTSRSATESQALKSLASHPPSLPPPPPQPTASHLSSLASEVDVALSALHSRWAHTGYMPASDDLSSAASRRGTSMERSGPMMLPTTPAPPLPGYSTQPGLGERGSSLAALRGYNPGEALGRSGWAPASALEAVEQERSRRVAAESRADALRAEIAAAASSLPPHAPFPNTARGGGGGGGGGGTRPPPPSTYFTTPSALTNAAALALDEAQAAAEDGARQARVAGLRSELESERSGNLAREQALRGELERERQAEAAKHSVLEGRLAQAETALSALSLENSKLRTHLEATAAEVSKALAAKVALQEENTRLTGECTEVRSRLSASERDAAEVHSTRETHAATSIHQLESKVGTLTRALTLAQAESGTAAALAEERLSRITSLSSRLAGSQEEVSNLESEVRRLRASVMAGEASVGALEKERGDMGDALSRQETQLTILSSEVARLRRICGEEEIGSGAGGSGGGGGEGKAGPSSSSSSSTTVTAATLPRLERQLALTEARCGDLEGEIARLKATNASLLSTLAEVDGNINRLTAALSAAEGRESKAVQEVAEHAAGRTRHVAELTARATTAEREVMAYKGRLEAALSAGSDAERRCGVLSERCVVEAGRVREAEGVIDALRAEVARRGAECAALAGQVGEMAASNEVLVAARAVGANNSAALEGEVAEARVAVESKAAALALAQERARGAERMVEALEARIRALESGRDLHLPPYSAINSSSSSGGGGGGGNYSSSSSGGGGGGGGMSAAAMSSKVASAAAAAAQAAVHVFSTSPRDTVSSPASSSSSSTAAAGGSMLRRWAPTFSPTEDMSPGLKSPYLSSKGGGVGSEGSFFAAPPVTFAPPDRSHLLPSVLEDAMGMGGGNQGSRGGGGGGRGANTGEDEVGGGDKNGRGRRVGGGERDAALMQQRSRDRSLSTHRDAARGGGGGGVNGTRASSPSTASSPSRSYALTPTNNAPTTMLSVLGQRSTAPIRASNHRRVQAALTSVLLAGPQGSERLRGAKKAMDANGHRLLVIAMVCTGAKASGTFAGLYAVIEDGMEAGGSGGSGGGSEQQHHRSTSPGGGGGSSSSSSSPPLKLATRVMGTGPPVITSAMVHTLFKYDTAARAFKEVGRSGTFTLTVDALGVDASHFVVARSGNGTVLLNRESN